MTTATTSTPRGDRRPLLSATAVAGVGDAAAAAVGAAVPGVLAAIGYHHNETWLRPRPVATAAVAGIGAVALVATAMPPAVLAAISYNHNESSLRS